MSDPPAPPPSPPVPQPREYRLELNNWLQSRGLRERVTWRKEKRGPDDSPIWLVVYECPFHFSLRFPGPYLQPTVDGNDHSWAEDKTVALAGEEAARIALRRFVCEETKPLIERRKNSPTP